MPALVHGEEKSSAKPIASVTRCLSCFMSITPQTNITRWLQDMPRRRRPSPPAPGSIPPRNIAPKPDPSQTQRDALSDATVREQSSSSRQSTAESDTDTNSCGVPQCNIANCNLPTHLRYGRQRRLFSLRRKSGFSSPMSPSSRITEATSTLTLNPEISPEMRLPLEDADQDFRYLYSQFFTADFDRLTLIYRPQRRDPAFKEVSYKLSQHNPVYCLTLIAQSHMANIKDNSGTFDSETDRLTNLIYSKLLQMTREKVESFDLGDIDILLLAIVTLCLYDLRLDRYDALRSHHIGMAALVSKRGGVHNLGISLPYVLRMDRLLAIRVGEMPQFVSPELPASTQLIQSSSTGLRYGSYFHSNSLALSHEVLSLCIDAAQLLELVVEVNITFDPLQLSDNLHPKLEYFYFLRENIEVRHAILNHQRYTSTQSINKDLLAVTATKIVTYYVTTTNYFPVVTDLLATRLWNGLAKAALPFSQPSSRSSPLGTHPNEHSSATTINLADWTEDMPMLLWLLCACALPSSREPSMSFASHLASASASPKLPTHPEPGKRVKSQSPALPQRASSHDRPSRSILSPSSPRRHRHIPELILHVAEHLVGERPLSGAGAWDRSVLDLLESFVWSGDRLTNEYHTILGRLHEIVVARVNEGM